MNADSEFRRLVLGIVASGNALLREVGRLFKPHGITAVQFNVLNLLVNAKDGLRPSDLTRALVVDASSTTYVIDCMEELGWLGRRRDESDRRATRIVITAQGREIHATVAPLYLAALREALGGIDFRKIGPLADALGEIGRAAHAAVDTVLESRPPTGAGRQRS